jgi:RNA polymerase sigma factor (sigma-70 family)
MSGPSVNSDVTSCAGPDFRTTHWSMVLQAGGDSSAGATAALETLCRNYWYPIYVYVRRQGHGAHDAQDLTQDFFAQLLRLNSLEDVAPHKGKFRTFLLASLKHFLADAWDAGNAAKRGGGQALLSLSAENADERYRLESASDLPPDVAFERRWMLTLLEQALARLREEYRAADKAAQFDGMKTFLENPTDDGEYGVVASKLGMNSGAVAVAVHRLRQRYRDLVRAEIANTVSSADELTEEMGFLFKPSRA